MSVSPSHQVPHYATFEDALQRQCTPHKSCVLAVSGGADSMALLHLVKDYNDTHRIFDHLYAATFDHGLRTESRAEARMVSTWCKALDIDHTILTWDGEKPKTAIQKKARKARYAALINFCKAKGAHYVLTAHQQDDQIETFFLRLFKGSGVQGLCSMRVHQKRDDILLLRPMLYLKRVDIETYLKEMGQDFIRDPSNENTAFERIKLRQMIRSLHDQGFDISAIVTTIHHAQDQTDFIKNLAKQEAQRLFNPTPTESPLVESYTFDLTPFLALDPYLQRVILRAILWQLSGKNHPPKFDRIEGIMGKLTTGKTFTAAGYYWTYTKEHYRLKKELRF